MQWIPQLLSDDAVMADADVAMLSIAFEAIRANKVLRLDYSGSTGKTRRDFEPFQVMYSGNAWYILGWDQLREDWRTLRLDRIVAIDYAPGVSESRSLPSRDVVDVLQTKYFHRRGLRVTLLMDGKPSSVVALLHAFSGLVELCDDRWRLCMLVDSPERLLWWLTVSDCPVVIEGSPMFVGYLQESTRRLQSIIDSDDSVQ